MSATVPEVAACLQPMSPIELAAGMIFGRDSSAPPLPGRDDVCSAREAFESVVLQGLLNPPCVVSFSGGRDSSAALAVAVDVARRFGLEPPLPITLRFSDRASTDESDWQQMVVDHLGIKDWVRVELVDELDVLGPLAQRLLLSHGVLWPPNTHFHAPIMERASGGTVLTGFGGDEMLSTGWAWERVNWALSGQVSRRPKDLGRALVGYGPRFARERVLRKRLELHGAPAWLTQDGGRELDQVRMRAVLDEPVRWDACVRAWWAGRYRRTVVRSLGLLASDAGGTALHPFADGTFISALARERGRAGFRRRSEAMESLFGDLLPRPVLDRTDKAEFNAAFWTRDSREFAARWDGSGLDEARVRPDVLQDMWSTARPDARTYVLLQTLWLGQHRASRHGPGNVRAG